MNKRSWLLWVGLSAAATAAFVLWPTKNASTDTPPGNGPSGASAASGVTLASRPTPVEIALVGRRDVPIALQGLGNIQAFNSVTVRPQVDGQLIEVRFTEGQTVRAGDVLARIDPRIYQAALDQAQAKKAQDEAQLANARNDLARYAVLVKQNYTTRQQFDTTRALVTQYEAAVRGDQAVVDNAHIQVGYTTITAPIEGRVGIRLVDQGNIVHASDPGGLVVISQMRPITVIFTLPEDAVPHLNQLMATDPPTVTVLSRDGRQVFDQGRLALVDNQIDPTTATVRLKGTLPNQAGLLWPGQFVNVRVLSEIREQALTVPATAVLRGQQGAYAYVVREDRTVAVRPLTVGPFANGVAVIEAGLTEGETVVTAGQYRLQPGARVEVRAAAAKAGEATTAPEPRG